MFYLRLHVSCALISPNIAESIESCLSLKAEETEKAHERRDIDSQFPAGMPRTTITYRLRLNFRYS